MVGSKVDFAVSLSSSVVSGAKLSALDVFVQERYRYLWDSLSRIGWDVSRSQDYEYVVSRAVEERGKRPNMRAVLEHDGLVWNRNQRQVRPQSSATRSMLVQVVPLVCDEASPVFYRMRRRARQKKNC